MSDAPHQDPARSEAPAPIRPSVLRWVLLAKAAAGLVLLVWLVAGWWLRTQGLTLSEAVTELRRHDARFEWKSIDKKHWQAQVAGDPAGEPTEVTDAREGTGLGCAAGMVRVKGLAHVDPPSGFDSGEIERAQDAACTDWISRDFPARCRAFDPAKVAEGVAKIPPKPMDFCIDRFEYPNVGGQNPMIVVTFREAEAICIKGKKRLCNETEWTFACEGEESRPYPYGFTRDDTACVMDRSWRPFAEGALSPRDGDGARAELDRLWQGEPSGSRPTCKSPFGVYDMTGNVDEWTRSVRSTGYASVLKGGYWGPVRARCRPATRAHNEDFVAYQQSFRCCAEADASVAPSAAATSTVEADASVVADAGLAAAAAADAAAPLGGDLAPQRRVPEDEDEMDALTRARTGFGCAISAAGGGRGRGGALASLVAVGFALSRARRLRRR